MINIDIQIDPEEIAKEIRRQTANQIRALLQRVVKETETSCRNALRKEIVGRSEYAALFRQNDSSYGLGGQLGLSNPGAMVDPIVEAVVNNFVLRPLSVRGRGRLTTEFGGIEAVFTAKDLWFLTNLPTASYQSNQHTIDWLAWLLFSGNEVVVVDYFVAYGTGSDSSRTDDAIMLPSGKSRKNFKIRANYAGTETDNWITRAAARAVPKIQKILENAVRKATS